MPSAGTRHPGSGNIRPSAAEKRLQCFLNNLGQQGNWQSLTMASLWAGVKLQDVKAQLQLRGHQVPDDVILSFLREAANSPYDQSGPAFGVAASSRGSETDTTCSETSLELDTRPLPVATSNRAAEIPSGVADSMPGAGADHPEIMVCQACTFNHVLHFQLTHHRYAQ